MATIIVQSDSLAEMPAGTTLVERVVPAGARDEHYLDQLLERLVWALADADALEPRAVEAATEGPRASRRSAAAATA